jgi:hypothetical protein
VVFFFLLQSLHHYSRWPEPEDTNNALLKVFHNSSSIIFSKVSKKLEVFYTEYTFERSKPKYKEKLADSEMKNSTIKN